uniref:Alcohol oxidase n=1 Tax=Ganoderma boninense TaxID=34458 RepID=A0A5K1JV33_9APHY|nr:Alcohol oxidase [Ganoderma boninense]
MDAGLRLCRDFAPHDHAAVSHLPYRALVGSLNYVATGSRPDISFAVQQLAQYLDCFTTGHWDAAVRVVRYLMGSRDLRLVLGGSSSRRLVGWSDSDHARCPDTRRSIGGYVFSLGSGAISWAARKQPTVASSTTEAEYIAAADSAKECVWLRHLLDAIGFRQSAASPLLVDNSGAIVLSGDQSFHARTKHIDVKYHYLREKTSSSEIDVRYVPSKDNVADIFTKPLPRPQFVRLRGFLGLR